MTEFSSRLHPPLPLVGASIAMERERQQNDRVFVNGCNPLSL